MTATTTGRPRETCSRRVLLRQAAVVGGAAAAVPLVIPVRVLGADAPSKRIAVGFIGTGRQAVFSNIPAFLRAPDAQVAALCDVDAWRLEFARRKVEAHYAQAAGASAFKGVVTCRDFRELPARRDLHLPLKDEKRDFLDAVKRRGPTLADAEVGHRTTSLCHLGHIAIQVGRKLTWDPKAERFPGDETANGLLQTKPLRAPWRI